MSLKKLESEMRILKLKLKKANARKTHYQNLARGRKYNMDKLKTENDQLRFKYEAAKQRAKNQHLPKDTMMNKFLMSKMTERI